MSTVDPAVVTLVERAKDGDAAAFGALYDRYLDQVFGYIQRRVGHRPTAEDLCSDVFMRAWRAMESFSWQGVDPGAWLIAIARNRINDHFKSARHRLEQVADRVSEPTGSERPDDPERVAVARDMARSLGRALELLRDDHREVLELRFVHNLSVADTAAVMGRTTGAVKALQYRALRALAEIVRSDPSFSNLAGLGLTALVAILRMALP